MIEPDADGGWRLSFACAECGVYAEPLTAVRDGTDSPRSAAVGEMGPMLTENSCPECGGALLGRAFVRQGVVWVEATCPRHGYYRDRTETDPRLFVELLSDCGPPRLPAGPPMTVVPIDAEDARGTSSHGVASALDHARRSGVRVCLTTTVNRALNRDQIGPLFEFAVANADAVASLIFQPVAFTERVSLQQLADQRYTLGELARAIARRSTADVGRDFLPLGLLSAIPAALGVAEQHATLARASAGRWSLGSYFLVGSGGRPTPLGALFHLRRLLDVARDAAESRSRRAMLGRIWDRVRLSVRIAGCLRRVTRETRWLPLTMLRSWHALAEAPGSAGPRLLLIAGVQAPDRYRLALPRVC